MRTKWIEYLNQRKQYTAIITEAEKESLRQWVMKTTISKCQLDQIIEYHRNTEWNEIMHNTPSI